MQLVSVDDTTAIVPSVILSCGQNAGKPGNGDGALSPDDGACLQETEDMQLANEQPQSVRIQARHAIRISKPEWSGTTSTMMSRCSVDSSPIPLS